MDPEFEDAVLRWVRHLGRIDESRPGFWQAINDVVEQTPGRTPGPRRGRWPAPRTVAVQATNNGADKAVQATPPVEEVGVQADLGELTPSSASSVEAASFAQEMFRWLTESPECPSAPRDQPRPETKSYSPPAEGAALSERETCWNCGSPAHFAYECPRPRRPGFCFRCGREGYTVRTCPDCGGMWKPKDQDGPEAPRRRGPPPGTPRY